MNPDHAGIYTALDRGFFRQAGLDVDPQVPSDPSAPIKEVAAGRVDLAVSYEPEVLLAADKGLDVEAVGAVVDSPLTSLISLPEGGIASAVDLNGKTVGTGGIPYQSDYLETIQAGRRPLAVIGKGGQRRPQPPPRSDRRPGGRDPRRVPEHRGSRPAAARPGPADRARRPARRPDLRRARAGRPTSTVDDHPEAIRAFIEALARGTDYARAHPQEAANSVLSAGMGLDPMQTRAEVGATLPLLAPPQGQPYGYLDPSAWRAYAAWMAAHDLITKAPPTDQVLTNELLP